MLKPCLLQPCFHVAGGARHGAQRDVLFPPASDAPQDAPAQQDVGQLSILTSNSDSNSNSNSNSN